MKIKSALPILAAITTLGCVYQAHAGTVSYPNAGTYNSSTYDFTASTTGDLTGYFLKNGASYDEVVGVLDNGVQTSGGFGLDNKSSKSGQIFDFGNVTAGDTLTFVLDVLSPSPNYPNGGGKIYSDPSMNTSYDDAGVTDHNHIYSTTYTGTAGIPAGTYVGFEDEAFPFSDYDYNDQQFVFTDTAVVTSAAPEPASWALLIAGVAMIGGALRFGRGRVAAIA